MARTNSRHIDISASPQRLRRSGGRSEVGHCARARLRSSSIGNGSTGDGGRHTRVGGRGIETSPSWQRASSCSPGPGQQSRLSCPPAHVHQPPPPPRHTVIAAPPDRRSHRSRPLAPPNRANRLSFRQPPRRACPHRPQRRQRCRPSRVRAQKRRRAACSRRPTPPTLPTTWRCLLHRNSSPATDLPRSFPSR